MEEADEEARKRVARAHACEIRPLLQLLWSLAVISPVQCWRTNATAAVDYSTTG